MILSVIIPCFKVEQYIAGVIERLPDEINHIIIVNDCSPDKTEDIIIKLMETNSKIIYIRHEKNLGVGGAMISGYKKSIEIGSDISIKLDGDNQMDPAEIKGLLKPIQEEKADFTKGNRFRDFKALRAMPISRRIGNLGLSFMIKAASGYWNIFDPANGYTAIRNDILKNLDFSKIHNRYFFESSMLIELYYHNTVICDIPMKAKYGDEVSGLSRTKTFLEFPPRLFSAFIRRILLTYFLYDFNIASVYLLTGIPLFLSGTIYGGINFVKYASSHLPAPTGTILIPTLLIILGFQLLLSVVSFDISNYPKK